MIPEIGHFSLPLALGKPLGDNGAWTVRIYQMPLIRWIWLQTTHVIENWRLEVLNSRPSTKATVGFKQKTRPIRR